MFEDQILSECLRIKFPELGMGTDLSNFNIGLKTEFRMIVSHHTLVIKLFSRMQMCNDKYFTNTLGVINQV